VSTGLDLSKYDEQRLRGVIELGLRDHPQLELIQALVDTGRYRTYVRELDVDTLEAYLAPILPDEPDRQRVSIIKFQRSVLERPPQG
jgi:hypothetical protein